jgi:hypothetical protein
VTCQDSPIDSAGPAAEAAVRVRPWYSKLSGRTKDSRPFSRLWSNLASRRQSGTERGLHLAGGRGGNGTATSEAS